MFIVDFEAISITNVNSCLFIENEWQLIKIWEIKRCYEGKATVGRNTEEESCNNSMAGDCYRTALAEQYCLGVTDVPGQDSRERKLYQISNSRSAVTVQSWNTAWQDCGERTAKKGHPSPDSSGRAARTTQPKQDKMTIQQGKHQSW